MSRIISLAARTKAPLAMTSKRHTIVGKAPFGTVRAEAREAIVRAWKAAGWPRPPRTETGYEHLQQCMAIYLQILFPEISPSHRDDIVGQALRKFMAPLHAHRYQRNQPPPEDLVRALEDAALDQADDLPRVGRNDQQVATLAFSATPENVRVGLAGLAVDGRALEFRVVTQYLDLVDHDPTRPPTVAEVVAGLGPGTATEQMVRQALLDFRQRLKAVAADDHA